MPRRYFFTELAKLTKEQAIFRIPPSSGNGYGNRFPSFRAKHFLE
jgi:hypothetical protein